MLFHSDGRQQVIQNPDQETALIERGFTEVPPPPKPSHNVVLQNQPRSIAEATAIGEQAARFDEKYKELYDQYCVLKAAHSDLQNQHSMLLEQHEQLTIEHGALVEAHEQLMEQATAAKVE